MLQLSDDRVEEADKNEADKNEERMCVRMREKEEEEEKLPSEQFNYVERASIGVAFLFYLSIFSLLPAIRRCFLVALIL